MEFLESLQFIDTALLALPGRTLREYFAPVIGVKKNLIIRKHRTAIHMKAVIEAIANAKKKNTAGNGEAVDDTKGTTVAVVEKKAAPTKLPPPTAGRVAGKAAAAALPTGKDAGELQLTDSLRRLAKSVVEAGEEIYASSRTTGGLAGASMPLDVDLFCDLLREKCEAVSYGPGEVISYPHEPPEATFVHIFVSGEATLTHFQPQLQRVTSGESRSSFFTSEKDTVLLAGNGVLLDWSKPNGVGVGPSGGQSARGDGMSMATSVLAGGEAPTAVGGEGEAGGAGLPNPTALEGAMAATAHHGVQANRLKNLRTAVRFVGQPTLEVVRVETIRGPAVVGAKEALSMAPNGSVSLIGSARSGGGGGVSESSRLLGDHVDVIRIRLQVVHEVLVLCALRCPSPMGDDLLPTLAGPPGTRPSASTSPFPHPPLPPANRPTGGAKPPKNTTTTPTTGGGDGGGGASFPPRVVASLVPDATAGSGGVKKTKKKKKKDIETSQQRSKLGFHPSGADQTMTHNGGGVVAAPPPRRPPSLGNFIQEARSQAVSLHYPQNEILLRQSWLLQDTQPQTIRHLIAHMTPRSYLPGDILACPHGSSVRELCFLRRGEVCIVERPPKVERWGGSPGGVPFSAHPPRRHRRRSREERGSRDSVTSSIDSSGEEEEEEENEEGGGSRRGRSLSAAAATSLPPPLSARPNVSVEAKSRGGAPPAPHPHSRRHPRRKGSVCHCDRQTCGAVVDIIYPGSSFGELSVLFGDPRPFTLVAKTPCDMWCLTYREFAMAMQRDDVLRAMLVQKAAALRVKWLAEQRFSPSLTKHLRESCEMFRPFPDIVLRLIQERIVPVVYSPGELIASMADRCTEMIFIMQGKVESLVKGLARYTAGNVLGASCLVGHRWPLALSAKTMVEGWRLSREQLMDALRRADILHAHSGERTSLRPQYMHRIFRPPFPEFPNASAEERNQMPVVPAAPGGMQYPEYGIRVSEILLRALCVVFKGFVKLEDIAYGPITGAQEANNERLARRHVIGQLRQLLHAPSGADAERRSSRGVGKEGGVEEAGGGGLHTALQHEYPSPRMLPTGGSGGEGKKPTLSMTAAGDGGGEAEGGGGASQRRRAAGSGGGGGPLLPSPRRGKGKHPPHRPRRTKEEEKERLRNAVLGGGGSGGRGEEKDKGGSPKSQAGMLVTAIPHAYQPRKQTMGNCPFLVDGDAAQRPFHAGNDRRPRLNREGWKKHPESYDREFVAKMQEKTLMDCSFAVQDPRSAQRLREMRSIPPTLSSFEDLLRERDEMCARQAAAPPAAAAASAGRSVHAAAEGDYGSQAGAPTTLMTAAGDGQSMAATTPPALHPHPTTSGGDGRSVGTRFSTGTPARPLAMGGGEGVWNSSFPTSGGGAGDGASPLPPSSASLAYPSAAGGPGQRRFPAELPPVHLFLQGDRPKIEISLSEAIAIGLVLRLPSIHGIESCVPVVDPDVCIGLPAHRSRRFQMAITPNDRHHKHCFQFASSELEEEGQEHRRGKHGKGDGERGSGTEGGSGSRARSGSCVDRGGGEGGGDRGRSEISGESEDSDGSSGWRGEEGENGEGETLSRQRTETLLTMWKGNVVQHRPSPSPAPSSSSVGRGKRVPLASGGGPKRGAAAPRSCPDTRHPSPFLLGSPDGGIESCGSAGSFLQTPTRPGHHGSMESGSGGGSYGEDAMGRGTPGSGRGPEGSVSPDRRTPGSRASSPGLTRGGDEEVSLPSPPRDTSFSRPRPPPTMSPGLPHSPSGQWQYKNQSGGGGGGAADGGPSPHETLFWSMADQEAAERHAIGLLTRNPKKALELLLLRFSGAAGFGSVSGGLEAMASSSSNSSGSVPFSFRASVSVGGGGALFGPDTFRSPSAIAGVLGWKSAFSPSRPDGTPAALPPFSFPREDHGEGSGRGAGENARSTTAGASNSVSPLGPWGGRSAGDRRSTRRERKPPRRGGGGGGGGGGCMIDRLKGLSGWPSIAPANAFFTPFSGSPLKSALHQPPLVPGVMVEVGDPEAAVGSRTTTSLTPPPPSPPLESCGNVSGGGGGANVVIATTSPPFPPPSPSQPSPSVSCALLATIPPLGKWQEVEDEADEGEGEVNAKAVRSKWKKNMAHQVLAHSLTQDWSSGSSLEASFTPEMGEEGGRMGGGAAGTPLGEEEEEEAVAERGRCTEPPCERLSPRGEAEEDAERRTGRGGPLRHHRNKGHPPLQFMQLGESGTIELQYTDGYAFPIPASVTEEDEGEGRRKPSEAGLPPSGPTSPAFLHASPLLHPTPTVRPRGSLRPSVELLRRTRMSVAYSGGGGGASSPTSASRRGSLAGEAARRMSLTTGAVAAVPPVDRFFREKRQLLFVDHFGVLNVPEDRQSGLAVVCLGGRWRGHAGMGSSQTMRSSLGAGATAAAAACGASASTVGGGGGGDALASTLPGGGGLVRRLTPSSPLSPQRHWSLSSRRGSHQAGVAYYGVEGMHGMDWGGLRPSEEDLAEVFVMPTVEEAEECMNRMQRDVDGLNAVAASQARERERLRFQQQRFGASGPHGYDEIQKLLSRPTMEETELMETWKHENESVLHEHYCLSQIPRALLKHAGVNYLSEAIREINLAPPIVDPPAHKMVLAWHDQLETHTVWDELGQVHKVATQHHGGKEGSPEEILNAVPLPPALRGSSWRRSVPSRGGSAAHYGAEAAGDAGESEVTFSGPGWEKTSSSKRVLASIGTRQIAHLGGMRALRNKRDENGKESAGGANGTASSVVFPPARPLRTPARDMTPEAYDAWVKEREAFLERYTKMGEK